MKITFAKTHRWHKEVTPDPINLFGKSEQAKLKGTLAKLQGNDITYSIDPLDESFFDWWLPLYQDRIISKSNPKLFDVREKTLGNPNKDKKYFSFTLFEAGERLGGVVFSLSEDTLFFAYRTLAYDWKKAHLRASPSLLVEYLLSEHAKNAAMKYISHGIDRNPYGVNSSIGLALFKLSTGCRPQMPKTYEIDTLETDELTTDALVLECPNVPAPYADITKAYLLADDAGIEKWKSLTKFPDILSTEFIRRG